MGASKKFTSDKAMRISFSVRGSDSVMAWKNLEVHLYKTSFGACVAFIANYDTSSWAKVPFGNGHYDLPPWSISILPDCKTEVFNTAKVNALRFHRKITPVDSGFNWQSYNEQPAASVGEISQLVTVSFMYLLLLMTTGSSSVKWTQGSFLSKKNPLTWYKTTFNVPAGNDPLALDMSSMGKGEIWVNGKSVDRHWPGYIAIGILTAYP